MVFSEVGYGSTLMAISQTNIGHFLTITRRNIPSQYEKLIAVKRMKTGRIRALVQQEIAFLSEAALVYSI